MLTLNMKNQEGSLVYGVRWNGFKTKYTICVDKSSGCYGFITDRTNRATWVGELHDVERLLTYFIGVSERLGRNRVYGDMILTHVVEENEIAARQRRSSPDVTDYKIRVRNATFHFDFSPRFGPHAVDDHGCEIKQPSGSSLFWHAVSQWEKQGMRVENDECVWS